MVEIPTLSQQLMELLELGILTGLIPIVVFAIIFNTLDRIKNRRTDRE